MNSAEYWRDTYLEIPYVAGGTTPDGFNCWGFLRFVLAREFGKQLPDVPLGDGDAIRAIHSECLTAGNYAPVGIPAHGDAALMRGGSDPHVGIYLVLDGQPGIMHALEPHGVSWTPMRNLRRIGFSNIKYYRVN